ncbi:NAD(P)-dependent oxidoreductase [Maritimibacter sp. DP1N21-5]|uniref:NAD(P)-dependent oxidoreductase n=1 Tax=Maritimibacter sp. DP1N21-5 TaxID=2836867 RepID=UPI001C44BE63|nr:NAD(P)H-binding protein [Maritimibacter sp. DP1N21-5]MBV7407835.1 NAD(P)H-binding protein [Maritimibacter sp. DP1N21-5]
MKVAIIGISGKLGQYMTEHCLNRGYEVTGVCRPDSVAKLDKYEGRIRVIPGRTDDREAVGEAVCDADAVLTVLVPWGVNDYASGTARAVLDLARPDARLVFSCGWHISRDGKDRYDWKIRYLVPIIARVARLARAVDLQDQVRATDLIFASDRRWTVVRGSDLEEGPSEGLPLWARHVGDPVLAANRTRRIDFALFMVAALQDETLIHEAPAIVSRASLPVGAEPSRA